MDALNGERLLVAWERGLAVPQPLRPLALLELALPEKDLTTLASMPLAERNALLVELRAITFGRIIEAFATCPACDSPLEFALHAEDVLPERAAPTEDVWVEAGIEMHMRAANTADLVAAAGASSEDDACALMLARTMGINQEELDSFNHAHWLERFEQLNQAAEMQCALTCSACENRSDLDFDIAGFLWREVGAAARRLLAEIDRLASAYGWTERAIITLSPARRNAYLELLNS